METVTPAILFNGPVEAGLRCVVLLVEAAPRGLGLDRLVGLDYLTLHSADAGTDVSSLHPPLPVRAGEVSVRRQLLENGLHLCALRGLVSLIASPRGFEYLATDRSATFLDAMQSPYVRDLRERASWAVEHFAELSDDEFHTVLDRALRRSRGDARPVALSGDAG